jgi:hypothetical protein
MAVGDVVADVASGTNLTFQPAAGVEVVITSVFMNAAGTADRIKLSDAALTVFCPASTAIAANPLNTKICINNTTYLTLTDSGGAGCGYTGLQIK